MVFSGLLRAYRMFEGALCAALTGAVDRIVADLPRWHCLQGY